MGRLFGARGVIGVVSLGPLSECSRMENTIVSSTKPKAEDEASGEAERGVPADLLDLLDRQLGLYRRLKEMSDSQRSLVSDEDPTALLGLLGRRQQVVEELASLNGRIAPVRRDWERIAPHLPTETRTRATRVFQQARSLLEEIIAADRKDSELLGARKSNVANTLKAIDVGRAACGAYARSTAQDSRYIDQMDEKS